MAVEPVPGAEGPGRTDEALQGEEGMDTEAEEGERCGGWEEQGENGMGRWPEGEGASDGGGRRRHRKRPVDAIAGERDEGGENGQGGASASEGEGEEEEEQEFDQHTGEGVVPTLWARTRMAMLPAGRGVGRAAEEKKTGDRRGGAPGPA